MLRDPLRLPLRPCSAAGPESGEPSPPRRKGDVISFLSANSWYSIKENIANTQAKVFVVVGQKEGAKMIRSAYKLNNMIPNSILEIKNEMCHGEYSINYAKEYASKVISMLESI